MPTELILTATLCKNESESNQFTLLVIQTIPGIVIAKTVVRQPSVVTCGPRWCFFYLSDNIQAVACAGKIKYHGCLLSVSPCVLIRLVL